MCLPSSELLVAIAKRGLTVIELQGPVPVNGFPLFEVIATCTQ